ncbi:NADP-binding protein [Gigaspora margarita]|uniref:NADP-binding protein n=1 Tax=Gigaspora margarita TaxID=4874 RepID=A0A8H4AE87_GIGMA|nr:NADP-binding protein [Gigaspora margarita]
MPSNKSIIFKAVPDGYPVAGEHMELVTKEIDIENFSLADGDILVKNHYMSLDPYMRGKMRHSYVKSYTPAYEIGQVLDGYGIAIVVKSNNKKYQVGDYFVGLIGWEEYSHITANVVSAEALAKEIFTKFKVPESHFIGLLGIPGMSAYVGLNKIGQPKKGETIFISAASGAVGQVVGQIAKIKGLRVIGSASDDSKIKYLEEELKFDGAFNYKTCNADEKLKELCPNGIDIYFDNVGGETLDIVINHLNNFARVVACGMISQYNTKDHYGVKNLIQIIGKRVLIQGFIVSDHFQEMESFRNEMVEWFKQGKLKYKEDIVEGIQNAPQALINILTGKKFGKMIVKIC